MANYQPLSPSTHADLRWNRDPALRFAAEFTTAVLTITELPRASLALPIAFVAQADSFSPVAILGFEKGKSLVCDPVKGWRSAFVPAVFATHPFKLGKSGEQYLLCVDTESDQLSETAGEPIFEKDGQLGPKVQAVADLLKASERAYAGTRQACDLLKKAKVLRPWDITVKTDKGEVKPAGLFQIDETALNAVPPEELAELRRTGGLMMAYCQLLSSQHLIAPGRVAAQPTPSVSPPLPTAEEPAPIGNGTIDFGGLR